MIKLIAFDWNGTLLSDTYACMDADNNVIKHFGGKPVNLKKYRDTIIIPSIDFYSQHGCSKEILIKHSKKLSEVFHSFYENRAKKCRTRKGAKDLLKWLKDKSIKVIILSNHTTSGISSQLKRLKLNKYIFDILANNELDASMKKRNKIGKLKNYINKKGFKKNQTLIIGDSPEESEIAKKLDIKSALITNGYYSISRLKNSNPDYLINNLSKVKRIINLA